MTKINIPQQVLDQPSRVDKPKAVAKGKAKAKKLANANIGDPSYDLIKVFGGRDIGNMDDDEYKTRMENLRDMRLMRFTTTKKVSALDLILASIDVNKARQHLESLEAYDEQRERERSEKENNHDASK